MPAGLFFVSTSTEHNFCKDTMAAGSFDGPLFAGLDTEGKIP